MPAGSQDKDTFIAYSIAQLLFPHKEVPAEEEQATPDSTPGSQTAYLQSVLTEPRYRQVLVSLRNCLNITEVLGTLAPTCATFHCL